MATVFVAAGAVMETMTVETTATNRIAVSHAFTLLWHFARLSLAIISGAEKLNNAPTSLHNQSLTQLAGQKHVDAAVFAAGQRSEQVSVRWEQQNPLTALIAYDSHAHTLQRLLYLASFVVLQLQRTARSMSSSV